MSKKIIALLIMLSMILTPTLTWGQTSTGSENLIELVYVNFNSHPTRNGELHKEPRTGQQICPEVSVWDNRHPDDTCVPKSEYVAKYTNNINCGVATVTVTAKEGGKYKGTCSVQFIIVDPKYYDYNVDYKLLADAECKLSKRTYVYTGKEVHPKVIVKYQGKTVKASEYKVEVQYSDRNTNIGTGDVEVIGKGSFYGKKKLTFKIVPRGTSVSSVKGLKKGMTVKWKMQSFQTTGYQIRYSTKANMSKAKTVTVKKNSTVKKTIKNLKAKKKYYVQVRTYKIVKGKKYYSKWSAKKSVVVK